MPTFKEDIKLGTKVAQLKTADYGDKSITIAKLAEEIWDKIKNEYLRLDGTNQLTGNLNMGGKNILNVGVMNTKEIKGLLSLASAIRFDNYRIAFGKYDVDAGYNPSFEEFGSMDDGELDMQGYMQALGFKTTNRANLGLLNNDGEVLLSMQDVEIDELLNSVFDS